MTKQQQRGLSVLIPVFNFDIFALVADLQLSASMMVRKVILGKATSASVQSSRNAFATKHCPTTWGVPASAML